MAAAIPEFKGHIKYTLLDSKVRRLKWHGELVVKRDGSEPPDMWTFLQKYRPMRFRIKRLESSYVIIRLFDYEPAQMRDWERRKKESKHRSNQNQAAKKAAKKPVYTQGRRGARAFRWLENILNRLKVGQSFRLDKEDESAPRNIRCFVRKLRPKRYTISQMPDAYWVVRLEDEQG
jgi:hypothetical protein